MRANGLKSLKSLRSLAVACFGTGTVVAVLKREGMTAWVRDVLKMSVKTPDCCSAVLHQP